MSLSDNENNRRLLKPCICGRISSTQGFYGKSKALKGLSPRVFDVKGGVTLYAILFAAILYAAPTIALVALGAASGITIAITVIRMSKGHSLRCSLRWTAIAELGLFGWVPFQYH